jgi:hypothetical protein
MPSGAAFPLRSYDINFVLGFSGERLCQDANSFRMYSIVITDEDFQKPSLVIASKKALYTWILSLGLAILDTVTLCSSLARQENHETVPKTTSEINWS